MFFYTHFVFVFLSVKYLSYNVLTFEEDDPRKCDAPVSPRLPRPGPALQLPAWPRCVRPARCIDVNIGGQSGPFKFKLTDRAGRSDGGRGCSGVTFNILNVTLLPANRTYLASSQ